MSDTINFHPKMTSTQDVSAEMSLNWVEEFLRESNAIENVWDEKSFQQAIKAWKYLIQWDKLTTQNILKTHAILMKGLLDKEETGAWRRCAVWIGGHEAKPWYVIPELMAGWINLANAVITEAKVQNDKEKLALSIQQDHISFESIHPWVDGNGRMGRILLNWQRIKVGLPILVIKETEKADYYKWFN